jgi:hypothetical protein
MAFLDAIHGRIIDPERDSRHVLEQALSERRQIIANRRLAEMEAIQRTAELAAEKEAQAADQAEAIKTREAQERMHGEALKSQAALQDKIGEQETKRQKASTLYGERLTARRRKDDLVNNRNTIKGEVDHHNTQIAKYRKLYADREKAGAKPEELQGIQAQIINMGRNLPHAIRQYVTENDDGSVTFKEKDYDSLIKSEDDYLKMLSVEESGSPQAPPPGTGAAIAGGSAANWLAGMPTFGGPVSRRSGGVARSAPAPAPAVVVAPNPPGGGGGKGIGPALAPGGPTAATPPLNPRRYGTINTPYHPGATFGFGYTPYHEALPVQEFPPNGPEVGPQVPITDSDYVASGGGGDFGGGLGASLGVAPTAPGSGIIRPYAPANYRGARIGAGGMGMFGTPDYNAMEQQRMQREADQRAALEASGYDIVGYE